MSIWPGPCATSRPRSRALVAGRAALSNVSQIAYLAREVGVGSVAPLEMILVGAAETLEPADLRTVVQATRLRVDPDGVLAADNRAHERRWFNLDQTFGGEWFAQGQFDAEAGALVKTWLDAITEMPRPGDTRSASQRRADALVDLAAQHLRCAAVPAVHGQRPHLTLTVSAAALRTGADAEAAMLQGAGPIHPETARRIACDAVQTEVTVAPPGDGADSWLSAVTTPPVPLSVGRATRTIPVHLRTALALRDQGCRFPGCDRPIAWTDGHHIIHWADGGPTELENLVSLCRRHHRAVHEQGWRIHMADGSPGRGAAALTTTGTLCLRLTAPAHVRTASAWRGQGVAETRWYVEPSPLSSVSVKVFAVQVWSARTLVSWRRSAAQPSQSRRG